MEESIQSINMTFRTYPTNSFICNNFSNFAFGQFENGNILTRFENQTMLPNSLKFYPYSRRFTLCAYLFTTFKMTLDMIFPNFYAMTDNRHIRLYAVNERIELVFPGMSNSISVEKYECLEIMSGDGREEHAQILLTGNPTVLVLEVLKLEPCMGLTVVVPDFACVVGEMELKEHKSFLHQPLSLEEIRENIRFIVIGHVGIEVRAGGTNSKAVESLCSISVLDYFGKVLMNSITTPRGYVKHYRTCEHKLREKDIMGQWDEVDCIMEARRVLDRKIIIGFHIYEILKLLTVRPETCLGIRDLAMANTLAEYPIPKKKDYKLSAVHRYFYPQYRPINTVLRTKEMVQKVRDIYLAIEYKWQDHLYFNGTEIQKSDILIDLTKPEEITRNYINPLLKMPNDQQSNLKKMKSSRIRKPISSKRKKEYLKIINKYVKATRQKMLSNKAELLQSTSFWQPTTLEKDGKSYQLENLIYRDIEGEEYIIDYHDYKLKWERSSKNIGDYGTSSGLDKPRQSSK